MAEPIIAIEWVQEGLRLIDQRHLPRRESYVLCCNPDDVIAAIKNMTVRGAPAIGLTAAYGVVLAARDAWRRHGHDWRAAMAEPLAQLRDARPTAVNLRWAVDRMAEGFPAIAAEPEAELLHIARRLHQENDRADVQMGVAGAALIETGSRVLTHCNTGTLATGGIGTALGVIRTAFRDRRIAHVYACEARPWLQGSRLTMWELGRSGIPATLIIDSAAAFLMQRQGIAWVIVGADRIAANGDVANKIGTYNLAVAARAHGVRFMVVAPTSTVDRQTPDGTAIRIEERAADELRALAGVAIAPPDCAVWNPVFDVTPAALIDAIVTERGVFTPPFAAGLGVLS